MNSVGKAGKDALLYLPGRIVAGGVGFVVIPLLTYFFPDAAEIGRYDLTMRFAQFLHTLTVIWLGTIIVRFYPACCERGESSVFFTAVWWLRSMGIAAGLVLSLLAYQYGPGSILGSVRHLLWAGALVFLGSALFDSDQMVLRAKGRASAFSLALSINVLAKYAMGFSIAVCMQTGIVGVLFGVGIVPVLLHAVWLRSEYEHVRLRLEPRDRQFMKEALAFGAPVGLTALLGFFLRNLDRYLLRGLTGSDELVGMFAVGNLFGEQPVVLLTSTLIFAAFPEISRIYDCTTRTEAETFLGQVTRVYLLVAIPVAVLASAVGAPFFSFAISGNARHAWDVVPLIAGAAVLSGLSHYATLGVYMAKRTGILLVCMAAAVVFNAGLNVLLIPRLAYLGCGVARLFASGALVLLLASTSRRHLQWRFPWGALTRSSLAAFTAAASVLGLWYGIAPHYPFPWGLALLALAVIMGAGVYGAILIVTGEITRAERHALLRFLYRR